MKKILLIAILSFSIFVGYAQVGINTTTPHPSSALQINGGGKGLLIPILDKDDRTILKNPAKGLLVCDTIGYAIPVFYYHDGDHWITLNPLQATEDNSSNLKLSNGTTITFDENDIVVDKTLTVNGNTTLKKPVVIDNTLTVNGNVNTGTINATSSITANKNIIAKDTIKASVIEGLGVTPIGGIIMWSGVKTSIPEGWALCDGKVVNGYTTPDLRGRFVVGYGENGTGLGADVWDSPYTQPGNLSKKGTSLGNSGGEMKHTLTKLEMPIHQHYNKRLDDGELRARSGTSSNDPDSSLGHYDSTYKDEKYYSSPEGGDQPHENRPPYYVLAFIMRIK